MLLITQRRRMIARLRRLHKDISALPICSFISEYELLLMVELARELERSVAAMQVVEQGVVAPRSR